MNAFAVGALVRSELDAEQRLTLTEDNRSLHPKEKGLEVAGKKTKKHRKTCLWEAIDLGSFEVPSDHGDTEEDGEESSFFGCWDEQSAVLRQADPWAWNAPKSKNSAKTSLPVLCVKSLVCTVNSCQIQLPSVTYPAREKVNLTKFHRTPPRIATPTMKSLA